jgi:hypothetical protein
VIPSAGSTAGSTAGTDAATDAATAVGRGIGVADMARAIRRGEPHRASGEMALHVLEMMTAIERSASGTGFEAVESVFDVPAELDAEWDPHVRAT